MEQIAEYAVALAEYKQDHGTVQTPAETPDDLERRTQRNKNQVKEEHDDVSTEPEDYQDVPGRAYIVVKEAKDGYRYYHWQWREGPDSWGNKYIVPVNPKE